MAERDANGSEDQADESQPEAVLDAAAVDAEEVVPKPASKKKAPAIDRPYPRRTLEDALQGGQCDQIGEQRETLGGPIKWPRRSGWARVARFST